MDSNLYWAAITGNVNVLVENKEKLVDEVTQDKNSVLHLTSQSGNTECVKEILKMHPSLLCKLNSEGETALHLAAKEGHTDVVQALIDEAKKSDQPQNPCDDHQDLEQGVGSSSSSVKETMIRMVNYKENDTALHEAARYNCVDVVRVLVQEDPQDSHTLNKVDESPLYLAVYRGHGEVVKVICETCISPAYGGSDGRTVLHAAVITSVCGTYLPPIAF